MVLSALRESEERFRTMFEHSHDLLAVADENGNTIWGNPAWEKTLGYSIESSGAAFEKLHPDDRARVAQVFEAMEQDPEACTGIEHRVRTAYGHYATLETTARKVVVGGHNLLYVSAHDITERKRAEEALMRQQRTITLNNRIANVFLISTPEEIYTDVLDVILESMESRFGYFGFIDDAENLVCPSMTRDVWDQCQIDNKSIVLPRATWGTLWGRSLMEKRTLMANEGLWFPEGHLELESALAVPIVYRDTLVGQFVVANKPGGYGEYDRELLESAAAQTAPVLSSLLEEARQRREHEKLEEQYHQAQKLESIGRLAGGVSHDLNNLLSPILGYGEMLLDDLDPGDARRESVDEILRAGLRARDLVRQLLAFSRKQTLEYKPVDMNKAVTGFEMLLRRFIREDIAIEIIQSPDIRTIMADIGQIEQVIMNLAVNAADAMPEGGRLTIETATADLDEDYAAKHQSVRPGAYVMLAVSDTGCGMDDETREPAFEPFFSTKGEQGTGLGLAMVYGIVKQHGGNIWVYSELDKGTTFKIYLPVSEEARVEEKTTDKKAIDLKGSETILLVEDNEQVRDLARAILRRQGYAVLEAENGPKALTVLASHDDPVHLLLTDVVMPEMNGKELFAKAAEKYPGLKVLYMSGYTANVIAHRGALEKGIAFIQKPFTIHALTAKVREVLEQD